MTHELVQKLRQIIDEKHRRAIEALETIGAYLDEVPSGSNGSVTGRVISALTSPKLPSPPPGSTSIRGRVLGCLKGPDYTTVDMIRAAHPGLDTKQIWGVIAAPDLKDSIERVTTPGGTAYRLRPKSD